MTTLKATQSRRLQASERQFASASLELSIAHDAYTAALEKAREARRKVMMEREFMERLKDD